MKSRPLSPHLQVYRLPLTALLSISHRVTGVVLSLGLLAIAGFLVIAAAGADTYDLAMGWLDTSLGRLALWLWIYALFFHACHGVRHLIWDTGRGLARQVQLRHNLVEIAVSLVLTAAALIYVYV